MKLFPGIFSNFCIFIQIQILVKTNAILIGAMEIEIGISKYKKYEVT